MNSLTFSPLSCAFAVPIRSGSRSLTYASRYILRGQQERWKQRLVLDMGMRKGRLRELRQENRSDSNTWADTALTSLGSPFSLLLKMSLSSGRLWCNLFKSLCGSE